MSRYWHLHVRLGNKIQDSFCVIIVVKDVHMIFPIALFEWRAIKRFNRRRNRVQSIVSQIEYAKLLHWLTKRTSSNESLSVLGDLGFIGQAL